MVHKEARYALNAPGVIFDEIDGEVLVIDLKVGHYFRLRESASRLWTLIINGNTFLEIIEISNSTPPNQQDIDQFILELLSLNLIVQSNDVNHTQTNLRSMDLSNLKIEKFTDLEDILGLDPIHEVDASKGWPFSGSGEKTN
jgi:hypothetical protein